MGTIRELDPTFDPSEYNRHAFHPLQSWQWGEARSRMGLRVVRLGEFDNGALRNVFLLTVHPLGSTPYKIGYLPRSVFPSPDVFSYLMRFGKEHNLIFIKLEPYEGEIPVHAASNPSLVKSPHALFPVWTQILSLAPNEEELMKKMKPKTRYNIRLAQKKGVDVREKTDDEGFEVFSRLYFETCRRQKYFGHTQSYHRTVWNTLKGSIAHILIAYYEGEPLAAYELFHFGDRFYYTYGGTSDKHRNLMAANLIMWESIRLGKKLNASVFDMWGSLEPGYDSGHPWAGFTRFKEGYGTEFQKMVPGLDLVINPVLYPLYNIASIARNAYLQVRRSIG
jgi:hypothetical protein